jgi:tetratricopeptide (TPR) repeat protein
VTPATKTETSDTKVDTRVAPLTVDQQWKQAIAFSNTGQWSQAIDSWSQFIRDHSGPNRSVDQESYSRLGIAYEELKNWSAAARALEQADLKDDRPNATTNLKHLGHCYIQLKRWEDAIRVYKRVLKIEPDNKQARQSLVWAVRQQTPE